MSRVIPTNLVILAIDALQVTMRKENIANPLLAVDYRFFSMMDADGCYRILGIAFAITCSSFKPVDSAVPGTKGTAV